MLDAFSFLYGILLIVMGKAFPISQVISNLISSHYYCDERLAHRSSRSDP